MSGDIFDISDNILKRDKFKFELAKEHFSHFFGGQKWEIYKERNFKKKKKNVVTERFFIVKKGWRNIAWIAGKDEKAKDIQLRR